MVGHHCPFCGSLTDRPVIFSSLKQRIFTYIWDNPGCTQKEIERAVYNRKPINTNTMSVHLSKIRTRLLFTAYQLISVPVAQSGLTGRVVGYKITYKPKISTKGEENALA